MQKRILFLALLSVSIAHGMQSNDAAMVQVPRDHYQAVMGLLAKVKENAKNETPPFYKEVVESRYDGLRVIRNDCLQCNSHVGFLPKPVNTCSNCQNLALFLHKTDLDAIDRLQKESNDILSKQK